MRVSSTSRQLASAICWWAVLVLPAIDVVVANDLEDRPTVAEILATWQQHAGASGPGHWEWQVVRQLRSPDFGADQAPATAKTDLDRTATRRILVSFDENSYRLQAESRPAPAVSDLRAAPGRDRLGAQHQYQQYHRQLRLRFEPEQVVRAWQPYVVVRDVVQETHLWRERGAAFARCAICRPSESGEYFSGGIAALLFDVLEATRCRQLAAASQGRVDEFELLEQQRLWHGLPCLVLQQRVEQEFGVELRRYWVDPERDYLVRRGDVARDGRKTFQFDVAYRSDDRDGSTGCVPQVVELIQFSADGGVYDQIVLHLRDGDRTAVPPADAVPVEIPDGCLVTDFVREQQYIAEGNGGKRIVTKCEAARGLRYDEISTGWSFAIQSWIWRQLRNIRHSAALIWWMTWPGVIGTVGLVCAGFVAGQAGWRRIRMSVRRTAGADRSMSSAVWRFAGRKLALVVVGLLLLAIVADRLDILGNFENHLIYEHVSAVWEDVRGRQVYRDSQSDWQTFKETTLRQFDDLSGLLARQSERHPPSPGTSRLSIEWSVRERHIAETRLELLSVLQSLRQTMLLPPESVEFQESLTSLDPQMDRARDQLCGADQIDTISLLRHRRSLESPEPSISPTVAGIVIVDGILFVAVLRYWIRRRNRSASSPRT